MSQVRLYIDEDAAEKPVVEGLRDLEIDVSTVLDSDSAGASDEEQLQFAAADGRCLYSLNVGDFCRLHSEYLKSGIEHAGIILIPRQRYSIGEKIRRISEFVESITADEMRNRLEFL